jgi:hypothetical protein
MKTQPLKITGMNETRLEINNPQSAVMQSADYRHNRAKARLITICICMNIGKMFAKNCYYWTRKSKTIIRKHVTVHYGKFTGFECGDIG